MNLMTRGLSLATLAVCAVAQADHPHDEPATELDPITVTNPVSGSLTQAGPNAAAQQLSRMPGNTSLIAREELQNRYTLSLRDALEAQPGVIAQTRYNEEVRLSIRGSGLSRNFHLRGILLTLDDIPVSLADGSGDFQEIDPLALRHIEVYRGANALPLGVAALGGAVRFVSPSGRTQGSGLRASLEAGSFDTRRLHGAIAGSDANSDYFAAVTFSRSDGEREQAASDALRLSANWGLSHGPHAETRLYLNHQLIGQEVPGTLTRDAALSAPQQAGAGNIAAAAARDIDSTRLAIRHARHLADGTLTLGAYGFDKQLFHPLGFGIIEQAGDFWGALASWQSADERWTLGAQWRGGHNDAFIFANEGNAQRGFKFADGDERSRHLSLYGQGRFPLAAELTLVAGALLSADDRDFRNRRDAAQNDRKHYQGLSPQLGLLWQLAPQHTLFANIARAYEAPTFSELNQSQTGGDGFVALDAQTSLTLELGSRGRSERLDWEVAIYRSLVRDELVAFVPADQDPQIPASTFNADRTIHQGVELALGAALWQAGAWQASSRLAWTWNDFAFDGDPIYANNALPGVPEQYVQLRMRLAHQAGVYLEPQWEWAPQGTWVDYDNSFATPGYSVLNLRAGWALAPTCQLYLDARNLADRRYLASTGTVASFNDQALFYPSEGRSLFVGLRWEAMP